MNRRIIFNIVGRILMLESLLMTPALLVSLIYSEGDAFSFIISIMVTLAIGFLFSRVKIDENDKMFARTGLISVSLSWVFLSVFGALPFYISGAIPNFVDALFESISGFTTTGSTILKDVEVLPHGILFWRSFTHWIGGMGVLLFTLAVITSMGGRTIHLLRAESPGPSPGKLLPKMADTARILYLIYIILTIAQVVLLLFGGMNLYDSLIHAFGTAGTGGFSNKNISIGYFNSVYIDSVTTIFMLIFTVNFGVYFQLATKNRRQAFKNEELKFFIAIVLVAILAITINIIHIYGSFFQALRYAAFQVATIISTTGYATADFNLWPQFSRTILLGLMFIGGCAGSTAGGIKVIRILMMSKSLNCGVKKQIYPNSVRVVKVDGKAIDSENLESVKLFFFAYMGIIFIATLLVSFDNFDFETNISSVITAISNVGPGFNLVGPVGNFSIFNPFSKIVLSLCMLIGRLEIYPVILLFYSETWKKS